MHSTGFFKYFQKHLLPDWPLIVEMSLCSVERDLKMGHGDLCVSRHFELGSIERIPQVSLDCAH